MGVIFQDFARYNLSAANNIAVGRIAARDDRARIKRAAAEIAGSVSAPAGAVSTRLLTETTELRASILVELTTDDFNGPYQHPKAGGVVSLEAGGRRSESAVIAEWLEPVQPPPAQPSQPPPYWAQAPE
jgi:hypothetical protein